MDAFTTPGAGVARRTLLAGATAAPLLAGSAAAEMADRPGGLAHRFLQVDVFSPERLRGNPRAVVVGADTLTDDEMKLFSRWTNLSETTFLLRPTRPDADDRVRIFSVGEELPFAGHPTLGTAASRVRRRP